MIKKLKKGFTLVELVVVIAVVAILAAVSVVSYIGITKKAKESNDHMVIDQINTSLASSQILEKKATVHEIVERFAKEEGYDVRAIQPELNNAKFVYSYEKGKFGYWKDNKVVYPADLAEIDFSGSNDLWFFEDEAKATYNDSYSHYLEAAGSVTEITTNGGLDVGGCTTISSINLTRTTKAAKDVVIRTNGGTLTVNAPADTVRHYGEGQVITLTAVGKNSYYENGSVEQVNIKKGRLVLTNNENASVETVYLQATGDSYDDIILATQNGAELPDLIARDSVSLPIGSDTKTVVTIQTNVNEEGKNPDKTETINLYPTSGTAGNDVYEATNGYNVSDLAMLVVEASSTEAKAQAEEQLPAEAYAAVTETKSAIEVHNYSELQDALSAKAKYVIVKADFSAANTIFVSSDIIIEGENHTITTSASRALRIQSNNVKLSIRDLILDSNNKCERGIQVDSDLKGHVINLKNVKVINNTMYAINMCDNTAGILNAENCEISGWSALNTWGSGHKMTFNSCNLKGTNNKSVGGGNNYAVLCLEADTTYKTSEYSSFNTVTLNNCVVTAVETNANVENIVNFNGGNPGSTGNTLITNGCTFNAANKHAYSNGGQGNSWLNNGQEMLINKNDILVDLSGLTIESDGYTASGVVKFTLEGKTVSFNANDAEASSWYDSTSKTTGMDYVFAYNAGVMTYSLDLDLWSGYAAGYALYLSVSFSN